MEEKLIGAGNHRYGALTGCCPKLSFEESWLPISTKQSERSIEVGPSQGIEFIVYSEKKWLILALE